MGAWDLYNSGDPLVAAIVRGIIIQGKGLYPR